MNILNFNDCILSKYNYTGPFIEGLASVQNHEGLYGFINQEGKEIIKCQYEDIYNFSSGLAAVQNLKGQWGYINQQGEEIISCQYDKAYNFSKDLDINIAPVKINGNTWIYIDKNGHQAIYKTFSVVDEFSEGYAFVRTTYSSKLYYINNKGKLYGPYEYAERFKNGKAIVYDNENVYIINRKFEILSKRKLDTLKHISTNNNEIFRFKNNQGKYGYLDQELNETISPSFKDSNNFSDDMAIVDLSDEFIGIINQEGKIIAFSKEYQYEEINNFSNSLAVVKNSQGLYGYINKEGKEIIPCQFKDADDFSEGLANVTDIDNKIHYIDQQGNIKLTIDTSYNSILELPDKTIYITSNNEQDFKEKKLQVLELVKQELLKQITDNIDDLAYTHTEGLYEYKKRIKTNNQ